MPTVKNGLFSSMIAKMLKLLLNNLASWQDFRYLNFDNLTQLTVFSPMNLKEYLVNFQAANKEFTRICLRNCGCRELT